MTDTRLHPDQAPDEAGATPTEPVRAAATFGHAIQWNLIGAVARVAVTIFTQLTLLRLLGPVIAGEFAIFMVITGIGTILSEGGMVFALTRIEKIDDRVLRNAIAVILIYSSVITAVMLASQGLFMSGFRLSAELYYVPLMATCNVIPLGLLSVPISLLKRQYRARDIQLVQLGGYLAGFLVFAVPAAFLFQSALIMTCAFTIQSFITLAAALIISRCPIIPSWTGARRIMGMSSRALLSNILFFMNESAANILTAHFIGTRAVGLYGTAWNLMRMPTDIIINTLHAPLLVSMTRDHGGEETRKRFLTSINILSVTIFTGCVLVAIAGNEIVGPLLGPKWHDAGPVLRIVALVMIVRLVSMLSGAIVWGGGKIFFDTLAQAVALSVTVGAFFWLRPSDAVTVALIVLVAISARMTIQGVVALRACRIGGNGVVHAFLLPLAISVVAMLPLVWIGPHVMRLGPVLGLFGFGLAAAGLFALRLGLTLWRSPWPWASNLRRRLQPIVRRLGVAALGARRQVAP